MARTGQAYSTAIADSINAFLKEDKWRFDFDSERGRFIFNLSLSSNRFGTLLMCARKTILSTFFHLWARIKAMPQR